MSAWLCSEEHLNCIVNAVAGNAKDFKMLLKENLRSLEARYPGRDFLKEWKSDARKMKFKPAGQGDLTQVIKCCDSFDYQACETDDYDASKAKVFVEVVRKAAILLGGKSDGPEYEKANWSL
jgi:hypothetical protein